MTEQQVRIDIDALYSKLSGREGKYIRNLNRYMYNGARREDLWTPNITPQAYVTPAQNTEGVQTQLNISRSCVDSIASKISQANVRPFFNPINGDYDTTESCLQIQHFSDVWLDEQHAYPKSVMCFRDAEIFDMGVMGIDPITQSLSRVPTYEYFIDPAEYYHGTVSRVMRWRKNYPLVALMSGDRKSDNLALIKMFQDDPFKQGGYAVYYDLIDGYRWEFFAGPGWELIHSAEKMDFETYGGLYRRPFVEMFYTKPIKGLFSTSLIDDLYPIQRQIDELVRRFDAATRKSGLQWVFVSGGSDLKASNMTNDISVMTYAPGPEGGTPTVVNPNPLSQQFVELLKMYIDQAYAMAGISQLSAQSQKPSGLNSGKGLDTLEDIESDRFNTQLQQFTHFLVDTMRVCIDTFPKSAPLLPVKIGREKLTWGDVRKQRDMFSVEFSAASALSKNPDEKIAQIQSLISMNLMDKAQAADMMQLPDLEGAYTLATSSYKNCGRVISLAIKDGNMDYPPTINLQMLQSEIIKKLNQLQSVGDDEVYINRLIDLLTLVTNDMGKLKAVLSPDPPKPMPPPPAQSALDGSQGVGLTNILVAIKSGSITPESGAPLIAAIYPAIPQNLIKDMIQGAMPKQSVLSSPTNQGILNQPLNNQTLNQGAVA